MSTPTLIGTPIPDSRAGYTARLLRFGDHPSALVPLLRRIWATTTVDRDTTRLVRVLLACDWQSLNVRALRRDLTGTTPVPGVGYPTDGDEPARTGDLGEEIDAHLEWLYLIDPDTAVVAVYEATRHGRWLPHSRHLLDPSRPLFQPYTPPTDGLWRCVVCGAAGTDQHEASPSMAGYGHDTAETCTACGAVQTADPIFGTGPVQTPHRPQHRH